MAVSRARAVAPAPASLCPRVGAHARPGALARLEIAVGREVAVRLDDDAARDPELAGEHARRRQRRSRHQPPVLDRAAQGVLEALSQPAAVVGPQIEQHVAGKAVADEIGLFRHGLIGR